MGYTVPSVELNDISLDDMRMFAEVVSASSITSAAIALGCSKQTVSRRILALEAQLGEQLLHRSTRVIQPTKSGAAYAQRCREVVELAATANLQLAQSGHAGRLRITADRLLGEVFVSQLVIGLARSDPTLKVDLHLTSERLDLVAEEIDIAFRVGADTASKDYLNKYLGPAEVRYCATPEYLRKRGVPQHPKELAEYDCIQGEEPGPEWPFLLPDQGLQLVDVQPSYRLGSFGAAKAAVLAGLGIALMPLFTCRQLIETGVLSSVLDRWSGSVGAISILYSDSSRRHPATQRVVSLAEAEFARAGVL